MKWRCGLAGLLLTVVSAVGVSLDGVALETERISINNIQSMDELFAAYEEAQASYLPVLLPDGQPFTQSHTDVLPFEPGAVDTTQLIPEEIAPAITGYRIFVSENRNKNGRTVRKVRNAVGDLVARLRLPRDYRNDWYVADRYPTLHLTSAAAQELLEHFDPTRITIEFVLIAESDLPAYVYAQEMEKEQEQALVMPMMYTMGAPLSPVFKFSAIAITTNGLELTLQDCPAATSNLTIATSSDMSNWNPLLTQSVQSGLTITLNPTNHYLCFAGYDADKDPDGDGIASGQRCFC